MKTERAFSFNCGYGDYTVNAVAKISYTRDLSELEVYDVFVESVERDGEEIKPSDPAWLTLFDDRIIDYIESSDWATSTLASLKDEWDV